MQNKTPLFLCSFFFSLIVVSCNQANQTVSLARNIVEYENAASKAQPRAIIALAIGVWKDATIKFFGKGTKEKPISPKVDIPEELCIVGQSFLLLSGQHLVVDSLYFRNGYSPKKSVISYMISEDSIAFNYRVTNRVNESFTKPNRALNDRCIEFYGKDTQLDHCYIPTKSNNGETIRAYSTGNEHINNYHQIINNYFCTRPIKGGSRAKTIRIGDSKTRLVPDYVHVSNNYFEACNGEVEIISDKSYCNSFTNNIFYKCKGFLVLRHRNYASVESNIFIGGDYTKFDVLKNEQAKNRDIIELSDTKHTITTPLKIGKTITIRYKENNKIQLEFTGKINTPAFKMNLKGTIKLENLIVKGETSQLVFEPLNENTSSAYNLFINNCIIEDFDYILKASKSSFADSISFSKTTIHNCENGIILPADEKGDYNSKMVTFKNCEFINIKRNVISFFQAGYNESIIGVFPTLSNNTFTNGVNKKESGLLIKLLGIINVKILDYTFHDNPVKLVDLLWSEKNKHHHNNTPIES